MMHFTLPLLSINSADTAQTIMFKIGFRDLFRVNFLLARKRRHFTNLRKIHIRHQLHVPNVRVEPPPYLEGQVL